MSMPVRLSDDLMELAKSAAETATRSLTAQVEHWALIGRAVESALDHASLTALKAEGGDLASAIPEAGHRAAVTQAILAAVRGIDRSAIRERIAAGKAPLHGIERSRPETVVRYARDEASARVTTHEKPAKYRAAKQRKRA